MCTHVSYKTTKTRKNFNNQETKIILLSDELWLVTNNSRSFVNRRCKKKYTYIKYKLKQMHMFNKKVIISYATLTIKKTKNVYK